MLDSTCQGCMFALPTVTDDDDVTVKCRRYPALVVVLDDEFVQIFPDANERCGEFKEADDPDRKDGAWVVWVWNEGPQCLFLHMEEIEAHRYAGQLSYPSNVKFWIFGEEFGTR